MPRLNTDYSKIIIYKLVKNDDYENENIYVGSTTDFIKRKNSHKNNCCNENHKKYNLKVYQNIRENGGWSEWNMIEIEKYPCNDKREAVAREEYWRCEFNAKLNMRSAFMTEEKIKEQLKQYRTEHAEQIKKYRTEHAEQIKEQQKQYRTENADKMKQYRTENADKIKEQRKQYRTENAEELKKYNKKYYSENAEKLKQKHKCECGGKYRNQSKAQHYKTKKHQKYINNKIEVII